MRVAFYLRRSTDEALQADSLNAPAADGSDALFKLTYSHSQRSREEVRNIQRDRDNARFDGAVCARADTEGRTESGK